jgi:hypothetical protein
MLEYWNTGKMGFEKLDQWIGDNIRLSGKI